MEQTIIQSGKWGTCDWAIFETGILIIGAGEGASLENSSPWEEFRKIITITRIDGRVVMPAGSSLANMFKNCENMLEVDLGNLYTTGVVDMRSMFENCSSLKMLELNSFDTSNVEDMGKMFAGCVNLANLDLSTFDTRKARNMRNMFTRCIKLHRIVIGDAFSAVGNGRTDCGELSIREIGKYKVAKTINVKGGTITYYENRGNRNKVVRETLSNVPCEIDDNMFEAAPSEYKFFGWCEDSECNGRIYAPGEKIDAVVDDLKLYAVWICPPKIGKVEELAAITYGMKIPFVLPKIVSENDKSVYGHWEVSPNGANGTWEAIDNNKLIPASYDGYLLRLAVKNKCGTAYSNIVTIKIRKAELDLSRVHWEESPNMIYDGTQKQVWLEGLPEGVTPIYTSNYATNAGMYNASVRFEYDSENYNLSSSISDYRWEIKRAKFNMANVRWDYEHPFVYDGTQKSVYLRGLPEGVEPTYMENVAINAGMMTASVKFSYDALNYEQPENVMPCVWEIKKRLLDVSKLEWSMFDDYEYDGNPKQVVITNLPEDAEIEYRGNEELHAGRYLATASVLNNYYTETSIEYEWEIKKARFDMTQVVWDYTEPYIYDRTEKVVRLQNIPSGLQIKYINNMAIDAGDYVARACFVCNDAHNYVTPNDMILKWYIKKAVYDMTNTRWTYTEPFEYDGTVKGVELVGLPEGVHALVENGTATNAGVYVAYAHLKYDEKNFEAETPTACQWQINKTKFNIDNVRWAYTAPFVYDGETKKIVLEGLPGGLNVEYLDNEKLDAGKYCAVANLMPVDTVNYEIPKINACVWAIKKANIEESDIVWSDDSEYVYDGTEKTVKIVSDISEKINVEYTGNIEINAGEHEAVVEFLPTDTLNYNPPRSVRHKWHIRKGNINMSDVEWDYTSAFMYDGKRKTVELTNIPDGLIVNYSNNTATDAGEYTAVASFELKNENYNLPEPMVMKWVIQKASYDMSNVAWQDEREFFFDGKEKTVELVGLPDGINPEYSSNKAVAAGDYVADVKFGYDEINYEKPYIDECRWTIRRSVYDIGNAKWDYVSSFVYDGSEKCVRVVDLPEGSTVEYSNAKATNAGTYFATADVIAEDGENYINTTMDKLTWVIEKGEYDMSNVRWDYEEALIYDGIEKVVTLKGLPEGVTPVYSGNRAVDSGSYEARVTFKIDDFDNYNVPTFESLEWEIAKAEIDMTGVHWNYSNELKYDGAMHEITLIGLPKGIKPIYEGNSATSAGQYKASVEFILYDNTNYYTPKIDSCNWEIIKADFDMSSVRWDYDKAKTYNSRTQGVYLENLPNGVTVKYLDNEAVDAGRYNAQAEFVVEDDVNYNTPSVASCTWEIVPAQVDTSAFKWDYVPGSFIYDDNQKSVNLVNVPDLVNVKYTGNLAVMAGHYRAIAALSTDNPNYTVSGELSCEWRIERAEVDMSKVSWNYINEIVFDGSAHSIELENVPVNLKVKYDGNIGINAGVYTATASFEAYEDNFVVPESMTCTWVIRKANFDISGIRWEYEQPYVYDGTEKCICLAGVPDNLRAEYVGNTGTNVGKYVAQADFVLYDDNYVAPSPIRIEWEIIKADYNMSNVSWVVNRDFVYDGTSKSVFLAGYPNDIEPIYSGNSHVEAGVHVASATFAYDSINYNEPQVKDCTWSINKYVYDMSRVYWNYEESYTYDGYEKSVELVNLPNGLEAIYKDNVQTNSGEYFAEVSFKYDEKNCERPSFVGCRWKIEKAEIPVIEDELMWNYKEPFVYDGKPKYVGLAASQNSYDEPQEENVKTSLFSKLFDNMSKPSNSEVRGISLTGVPEGFVVQYEENEKVNVGVYYARAILTHPTESNYKDYVVPRCRWEIKKANVDFSETRWNYEKSFVYDGEEKEVHLTGLPPQVEVKYSNNVARKAGAYEAQASFVLLDEENYEKPKPIKSCWWKIDKAKYDMSRVSWVYEDDLVYSGKEKTVKLVGLPDGVKIASYSGNKAVEAGTYTAIPTFKYKDPENYENPEIEPLKWRIQKKRINTDNIMWSYNESTLFVYDEQIKEVRLIGVPNDIDVVYINNCKIDAGTYVAKAKLTYDTKNYVADEIPDCLWKIEKATLDTSKVRWTYTEPFKYDGTLKKIMLSDVPSKIDVRYIDNKAVEIGAYTAKAYLTYNTANYNIIDIDTTIEWEIVR